MRGLKGKRKFAALGVLLLFILGLGIFESVNNSQVNAQGETKDNINSTNFEEVSKKEVTSEDKETDVKKDNEVDTEEKVQEPAEEVAYQEPIVQESATYDNQNTSSNNTSNDISTNSNNNSNTSNQDNNTSINNDNGGEISKPNKPTILADKACGYMTADEAAYYGVEQLGIGGGIASQMSGFDCISDYEWNGNSWEEVYKWDMPGYDFIGDDGNTYLILGNGYIEAE